MKTKINHAGRELGSKKLLAVLAVLAVTLVVLAVVPSAVSGDDQASEVVASNDIGLPAAVEGVVTLQKDYAGLDAVKLTKNVTLELKTLDLNGFNLEIRSNSETAKFTLTLKSTDAYSVLLANRSTTNVSSVWVNGSGLTFEGKEPTDGGKGVSLINTNEGDKTGIYLGIKGSNLTIRTDNNQLSTIQTGVCNTVIEFSENSEFTYAGGSVQNTGFVFTDSEADMTASKDGTSVSGYWYLENSTVKGKNVGIYAAELRDSKFEASGYAAIYTKGGVQNKYQSSDPEVADLTLCKVDMYGDSVIKAQEFRDTFPNPLREGEYFVASAFNGNPIETEEGTSVYQKVVGNLKFINAEVINEEGFVFHNVLFSGTALHVADGVTNEVEFKNVNCGSDGLAVSLGSIVVGGDISESESEIIVNSGEAKLNADVPRGVTVTVKSGAKLIVEKDSEIRVDGMIKIEKGGEMENSGTLNLPTKASIKFGQKDNNYDGGRFIHVLDSSIEVENYDNLWPFFYVDSHYKLSENFMFKVHKEEFFDKINETGKTIEVFYGVRDITIPWNGKPVDANRLQNAGAQVLPLTWGQDGSNVLSVIGLSYGPNPSLGTIILPDTYEDAIVAEVTITYYPQGPGLFPVTSKPTDAFADLVIAKADFSSELVIVTPGPNPTYTGTDLKDQFTFDVNYIIDGQSPKQIDPTWYKPIFNVKDEEGNMQPVDEVVNAGQYYVQLEATPENRIFQGMTEPIEVEVQKATSSIKLEDTTGGKFWTAMAYEPGMIRITPNPMAAPITATATIEGQNPYTQDIGANDNGSAQENLDAMLNGAYLNNKAGMIYKFKVEIEETNNTFGSEDELEIKVDEFVKLDDYLTVEAVNTNSPNVPSKTDVTVEKDPENRFRYNASGPVERDSQTGDYIFYLRVTAHDLALMNQSGENGCSVEFEGSDGVEISDTLITADGKYVRLEVTVKTLPMAGIITITATPNVENLSLKPATYTVDLSGLYPVELRIVFHDTYNTMTFTENLIAYAYILDKLQGVDPDAATTAQKIRDLLQFEVGDYFLLPAPSDGKQWRLSFTDSNDEPVDQYYAGNSFYVIKEEHKDATNAIHFYASSAPAPAPETAKVIFVYGENADIRALPFGTLEVPEDIIADAQREGFDLAWYCNGEMITEETPVADGMVVVAQYTATPVDPDSADVFFVYGNKVTKATVGVGALVIPEDINAEAQMDGYDLEWYCDGNAITEETQVVDGMIVVAQYTVSETSDKISVGISYVDGKVYYTITALDGKAIPIGKVTLFVGTVTPTPWGDAIINGEFGSEIVDMTGADHIVGSFDLDGMEIWNAYVVFDDFSNEVKSPTIKIEA